MTPSLLVVNAIVFVDMLGFAIILPLLPYYAEALGAGGLGVGGLLTSYAAAQFVGAPLLGRLSDRVGRRPVLLVALAGSTVSLALTGLAATLPLLLAARAFAVLFAGSIATAQAYAADVTGPADRAKAMGMIGASIGVGFVFGPALGAALAPFGFAVVSFAAAGIAGANLVVALFVLKEPPRRAVEQRRRASLVALAARPDLSRVVLATFAATVAFVALEAVFALLGEHRFGLDQRGMGLVFTYIGVIVVVVQGGLVGRLNKRIGERRMALTGALLLAGSLFAVGLAPSLGLALLALGVTAAGQGLLRPGLSALLSLAAGDDEQGAVLGVGQSAASVGRALGPMMAGALWDAHGALPFYAAAGCALVCAVLVFGHVPGAGRTAPRPEAAS